MKSLIVFLVSLIVGCTSQNIRFSDVEKNIKIKCSIINDTLNTFENVFITRNSQTPFYLSSEEQNKIITAVQEARFFELPDTILRFHGNPDEKNQIDVRGDPHFCQIELDGREKSILVEKTIHFDNEEYLRFNSVFETIVQIVWSREEYRLLPRSPEY